MTTREAIMSQQKNVKWLSSIKMKKSFDTENFIFSKINK
jgi:hypothetical protein